jgi:hypothetical protein
MNARRQRLMLLLGLRMLLLVLRPLGMLLRPLGLLGLRMLLWLLLGLLRLPGMRLGLRLGLGGPLLRLLDRCVMCGRSWRLGGLLVQPSTISNASA